MAENKDAGDAGKKPNKGKLVLIGALAALLLTGGGGAAWLLTSKKGDAQAEKKAEPKKMPVFVDLDTFVVNLHDKEAERYMQVKLVAEVRDAPAGELIKTLMPSLRNEILLLLGSKEASQVASREGKEALAKEIVAAVNKILDNTPAAGGVEGVNFTHLIIQ